MDIELLQTFLEVKNTRHFGKAADNLYLTQAAVSARIKQLEDYLGVRLFIRSRNNIQLTAEGERLTTHAATILVAWSRARQDVALKPEQKRQLNVGTTSGLWQFVLQNKLIGLHDLYPDMAIRAEAYSGDQLLRLVMERVLDVALMYEPPNIPELAAVPLGKLKLVLASSVPGITVKAALQSNYVYVDWGTAFAMFHAQRFGDAPPAILHTNTASIAESFVSERPASAYLPEIVLEQDGCENIKKIDGAPDFSKKIYAVYRTNSERQALIEAISDYLKLK